MNTSQYLDAAKKKLGLPSDYALAKHLGITTSRMGNYRSGRSVPDALMCVRLAEVLGLEAIKVIADVETERATSPELQDVWRRIARKVAGVLVPSIAAFIALMQPAPAHAAALAGGGFNNNLLAASAVLAFPVRRRRLAEVFPQGDSNTHCARFLRALARLLGWRR